MENQIQQKKTNESLIASSQATAASRGKIMIQDWGMIDYGDALQRQNDLVHLVHQELARDTLAVCTHPPVVTLGRGTREGDVFDWQGNTVEVSRGGRATYHGPNQIVAYPIFDLNQRGRDLHLHMRKMEEAIIATLEEFGIHAAGRSTQTQDGESESAEATGVWIGSRKVASIGIGVRQWVSFHGLALNVDADPSAHQGLKPCGFAVGTMTSMEEILGAKLDREAVKTKLVANLLAIFSQY